MKRLFVALMLCLIGIAGFSQWVCPFCETINSNDSKQCDECGYIRKHTPETDSSFKKKQEIYKFSEVNQSEPFTINNTFITQTSENAGSLYKPALIKYDTWRTYTPGEHLRKARKLHGWVYGLVAIGGGISSSIILPCAFNGNMRGVIAGSIIGGLFGIGAIVCDIASFSHIDAAGIKMNNMRLDFNGSQVIIKYQF